MSSFSVTSAQLRKAAEDLRRKNDSFNSSVENLVTIEETLNKSWEAPSQEIFHSGFMTDKGKYDAFHTGINEYADALIEIAEEYERKEQANKSIAESR